MLRQDFKLPCLLIKFYFLACAVIKGVFLLIPLSTCLSKAIKKKLLCLTEMLQNSVCGGGWVVPLEQVPCFPDQLILPDSISPFRPFHRFNDKRVFPITAHLEGLKALPSCLTITLMSLSSKQLLLILPIAQFAACLLRDVIPLNLNKFQTQKITLSHC